MTGLLKDTLTERAAAVAEPPLDLDAIIRSGSTRIRRRRTTAIISVVAASALVLAGGVVTANHLATPVEPATGVPDFQQRLPTYAAGDTIHFGHAAIKVGPAQIVSFVQTDVGFVYADRDGNVYFADGRGGSDRKIGTGDTRQELTVDDDGTLVGWVENHPVAPSEVVLYDVAAAREVTRTSTGIGNPPYDDDHAPRVIAIDNDQVYFGAPDGIHRRDVATGKDTLLAKGALPARLIDVANGQLAYTNGYPDKSSSGIAVATRFGAGQPTGGTGRDLSPDGKYFFGDSADTPEIWSATNHEVKLDTPGYKALILSNWLDNDHFTAAGVKSLDDKNKTPLDLLTCSVKTASCSVTTPRIAPYPPDDGIPTGWQLPTGKPWTA
jgi:hypothetical protein